MRLAIMVRLDWLRDDRHCSEGNRGAANETGWGKARTQLGLQIGQTVEGDLLIAPQLVDAEVMSVLRRAVLGKKLAAQRAQIALEDLRDWPLERVSHTKLIRQAWQHRHNVTAYDAFYVAAARLCEVPLLTADGPLSRAPSLGIVVQNVRMA